MNYIFSVDLMNTLIPNDLILNRIYPTRLVIVVCKLVRGFQTGSMWATIKKKNHQMCTIFC